MQSAKDIKTEMTEKKISASIMKNSYITFYLCPIQGIDMFTVIIIPKPLPRHQYSYKAMNFLSYIFFFFFASRKLFC